jgi:hypothetical protein
MRLRILLGVIGLAAAVLAIAGVRQHQRYTAIRRQIVHDQQTAFYSPAAFHAVTYFRLASGVEPVSALRPFVDHVRRLPETRLIYAGRAISTAVSAQLNEADWHAVVVVQHPSRAAFDGATSSEIYAALLKPFGRTYTHGMERSMAINLALPQLLLGRVMLDTLTLRGRPDPLTPVDISQLEHRDRIEILLNRLQNARSLNDEALVMVNLSRTGTPEQQVSDAAYNQAMFRRMAHFDYGPIHIGKAVMLDETRFDNVMLVYYPGAGYFSDLIRSEFFTSIFADKQLADYQSVATIPLLPLLDD